MRKPNIRYQDEHGVINYRAWFKILMSFAFLYFYFWVVSYPLLWAEQELGNIKTQEDAFWLLQMACSTIGFGDVYPVTQEGRWIVAISFYVGVGVAGYIGSTIANIVTGFAEQSVDNKELRSQNAEILRLLNQHIKEQNEKEQK